MGQPHRPGLLASGLWAWPRTVGTFMLTLTMHGLFLIHVFVTGHLANCRDLPPAQSQSRGKNRPYEVTALPEHLLMLVVAEVV